MLIAAMILGLLGGIIGLFVGFLGYAGGALLALFNPNASGVMLNVVALWLTQPRLMQILSIAVPVVTVVGGGLATSRPRPGGTLMLIGAFGFFIVFGLGSLTLTVNTFVAIPFGLALIGGILALVGARGARRPPVESRPAGD